MAWARALNCSKKPSEKDPNYALAYTGLLDGYTYLNNPLEARKVASQSLGTRSNAR